MWIYVQIIFPFVSKNLCRATVYRIRDANCISFCFCVENMIHDTDTVEKKNSHLLTRNQCFMHSALQKFILPFFNDGNTDVQSIMLCRSGLECHHRIPEYFSFLGWNSTDPYCKREVFLSHLALTFCSLDCCPRTPLRCVPWLFGLTPGLALCRREATQRQSITKQWSTQRRLVSP